MSLNVAFSSSGSPVFTNTRKSQGGERIPAAVVKAPAPGSGPDMEKLSANLKKLSGAFNKKLQFVVDNESNRITVKVIDADTDKVIKILPPEELRRLGNGIDESGLLLDTNA